MIACPECECPLSVGRCDCRRDWTETGGVADLYVAAPERGEDPALTSRIREFYEDRSPAEDPLLALADPLLTALDALLPANARVVDLGCGSGGAAARLGQRGRKVLGVDLSMTALLRAESSRRQAELPSVSFVRGNLLRPPVAAASMDAVLCLGSLETCGAPEAGVAAAAELLVPGGLLVARVASPWAQAAPPDRCPPHDGRYPLGEVRAWFAAAKLRAASPEDLRAFGGLLAPGGGALGVAWRSLRWAWFGGGPPGFVVVGRR